MTGLRGANVVITGAGGGIGNAVAGWLVEQGAQVWAADLQPADDQAGTFVELDVTDPARVAAMAAEVRERAGRIDGLVAAAGVVENDVAAEDIDVDTYDRVMGVNLRGLFLTCQAVGRIMLEQGAGRIVTIASMSGSKVVNVPQRQSVYNSSKAGVVGLTKSLAAEWASRGVRVNAISPGYVDTPLLSLKTHQHGRWRDATPAGRFAQPAEIAAAIGYLLSDEAAFCIGTELLIDGGYSLW